MARASRESLAAMKGGATTIWENWRAARLLQLRLVTNSPSSRRSDDFGAHEVCNALAEFHRKSVNPFAEIHRV